jgi:predicted dehydrogenase
VHVLVEKPMAMNVAETDAMMEAARTWGAILGVGLEFRFFDGSRWVKELLADGLLGPIRRFDLRQGVIPSWPFATDFLLRKEMAGGGVLADLGVHVLDLLLWWLGDWESVEYRDDAAGGLESDAEMELVLRSGARGTVEVSRTRLLRNTCLLEGERGTLEVGIWDPDPVLRLHLRRPGGRLSPFERDEIVFEGFARGTKGGTFDMRAAFRRQVDDFASAIREKRETFIPGIEGRRTLTLIEACYAKRTAWDLPWRIDPLEAVRRADAPEVPEAGLSAGAPAGGPR